MAFKKASGQRPRGGRCPSSVVRSASKTPSTKHQALELPQLVAQLKEAGYTPVRITRLPAGTTELHLKPAGLKGSDGNVRAESVCNALGLPCSCKRLAALPQAVLVVRVPSASCLVPDASKSAIGNRQSEIQ